MNRINERKSCMEIVQENNNLKLACRFRRMQAGNESFHWHENYEICHLLNKPCSFLIDGVRIDADKGDIIAIDSYTVHRFLVPQDSTEIRILQFPVKLLFNACCPVNPLRMHIKAADIENIPGLRDAVENLFRLIENEGPLYCGNNNPCSESLTAALYFMLMRHFAYEYISNGNKDRVEFYRITGYISANLCGDLTAQAMSKALFISRGKLTSVFLKYAGVSLNEYVNSLRVQHARSLLEKGCTVTDAAFESGFQSIRTFNSVYKRLTGETPGRHSSKE